MCEQPIDHIPRESYLMLIMSRDSEWPSKSLPRLPRQFLSLLHLLRSHIVGCLLVLIGRRGCWGCCAQLRFLWVLLCLFLSRCLNSSIIFLWWCRNVFMGFKHTSLSGYMGVTCHVMSVQHLLCQSRVWDWSVIWKYCFVALKVIIWLESVDAEAQMIVALSQTGTQGRTSRLGSWFEILPTRDFQFCVVCHIKDFLGMLP
jgi:hypothetical protein